MLPPDTRTVQPCAPVARLPPQWGLVGDDRGVHWLAPEATICRPYGAWRGDHRGVHGLAPEATFCRPYGAYCGHRRRVVLIRRCKSRRGATLSRWRWIAHDKHHDGFREAECLRSVGPVLVGKVSEKVPIPGIPRRGTESLRRHNNEVGGFQDFGLQRAPRVRQPYEYRRSRDKQHISCVFPVAGFKQSVPLWRHDDLVPPF